MKRDSTFDFHRLTGMRSDALNLLKLLLLFQVISGHLLTLLIPDKLQGLTSPTEIDTILFFKYTMKFGRECAYLFVYLSGFFSATIFFDFEHDFEVFGVLRKRVNRIYPIFTFALLLTLILDIFGESVMHFDLYKLNPFNDDVTNHLTWPIFLKNFLSLQPTFSLTFGSNGPLWTLGYLMQFFTIASVARAFGNKSLVLFLGSLCFIALVISFFNLEFALLLTVWLCGALTRRIRFSCDFKIKGVTFLLIIFLLILSRLSASYISMLMTPITGGIILFFISQIVVLPSWVVKFFPRTDISYCLYAFHMPIAFLLTGFSRYLHSGTMVGFVWLLFFVLILIAVILISLLSLRVFKATGIIGNV